MDPLSSDQARLAGEQRRLRLQVLGLNTVEAEATFDRVARLAASFTQSPLAMVNFINDERQMFRGMYVPTASPDDKVSPDGAGIAFDLSDLSREAPGDYGFCPHVVAQGSQLALDDVFDYPRFKGNPLVNDLGVRSYLGTPLRDNTGMILGTVCVADTKPRVWDRAVREGMQQLSETLLSDFKLRDSLLAQQQELFAVFDGAPFPIMLTEGPNHLLRYANGKQGAAFGMVPQFSPGRLVLPGLEAVGVFNAMDDAFHTGQPATLSRAAISTYDDPRPQDFNFLCTPVRTSPGAPVSGVLTVAMNTTGQAYPGAEQQAFAANVQERFERLGAGGLPGGMPGGMPGRRVESAGYPR
ncbi:GAF domain-containing protein [Streptomyces yaanensis]|uniref:GAF domain-containing protein n=1 Tax=Streptomyces yaanensis TaxID=1142239 RepID=A0ABV7S4Y6_9ACTN|nr:GAF domain-containing protein [Streptomyces sp. CGMCC 4.7035]WNB99739.1 GAF domain-containing protein [Streptomyces sp. CGMCC 4.7035]